MNSGNRIYIVAVASLMVALLVASLMLELNAEERVANIKDLRHRTTAQNRRVRSTSECWSMRNRDNAAIC